MKKLLSILMIGVMIAMLGGVSAAPTTITYGPIGPNYAYCNMDGGESDYVCTSQVQYDDSSYAYMDSEEEVQGRWEWISSGIPTDAVITDVKVRVLGRETNQNIETNIQLWSADTDEDLTGYQSFPFNTLTTLVFDTTSLENYVQGRISAGQNIEIEVDLEEDGDSGYNGDEVEIDYVSMEITYYIPDTTGPEITNIDVEPQYPTCSQTVTICADVTDTSGVSNVRLDCASQYHGVSSFSMIGVGDRYCAGFYLTDLRDAETMSCEITALDTLQNEADEDVDDFTYDCATPVAEFTCTPLSGDEDFTTSCTSTSDDSVDSDLEYAWTFGDGGTSTLQNPSHEYTEDGLYTVTLTVTDDAEHSDTMTRTDYINVLDVAPDASFDESAEQFGESQSVSFTDTSKSHDSIISWSWNFGDDETSTLQNPSHTYADDGIYTVTLTVCDLDGDCDSATAIKTVTNEAPNVNAGEYTCNEAQTITLTADATDVAADLPLTFAWDFDGDEDYDDAFGQSVSYTCGNGDANIIDGVTVKVTDNDDAWNVDDAEITINNVAPVANANGPYSAAVYNTVCLTGSATDVFDTSFNYEWDLNYDGETFTVDSTDQNPCTTYSSTGLKNVALRVYDGDDYSVIATSTVDVHDYSISLDGGWNLISIPLVPENDDTSIDNVFGNIADKAISIWSYTPDTESGRNVWNYNEVVGEEEKSWSDEESKVQNIVPGYGYYLHMDEAAESYQDGNKMYGQGERSSPPVVQLTTGWNLIGHYGMNNVPKDAALYAFSGTYATLLDKEGDVRFSMNPTEGYWLFVKSIDTGEYAPSGSDYMDQQEVA